MKERFQQLFRLNETNEKGEKNKKINNRIITSVRMRSFSPFKRTIRDENETRSAVR